MGKPDPGQTKFCKICEEVFPWTPQYFHYFYKGSGRLHPYCKTCKIKYVMNWKHGVKNKKVERRKKSVEINLKKFQKNKTVPIKKKRSIRPISIRVSRRIETAFEIRGIRTVSKVKNKTLPTKNSERIMRRKEMQKAVYLFLSSLISTTDLIERIEPFYGARTKYVVMGLRARMGL